MEVRGFKHPQFHKSISPRKLVFKRQREKLHFCCCNLLEINWSIRQASPEIFCSKNNPARFFPSKYECVEMLRKMANFPSTEKMIFTFPLLVFVSLKQTRY